MISKAIPNIVGCQLRFPQRVAHFGLEPVVDQVASNLHTGFKPLVIKNMRRIRIICVLIKEDKS